MILEIRQLAVRLGKRNVLRDVSLSVSEPLVFLIGQNGSGKTTLLRAISGEVTYSGAISLDQTDLQSIAARHRARQIAFVHQRPQFPFQLTVFDFILMGRFPYLAPLGNYSRTDHVAAEAAIDRLVLGEFRDRKLDEVSGGELQRVLLARALCQDAPWLLLDEPAQQLDPRHQRDLYQLLKDVSESGKQVLCTTHDREAIENAEARVIGLRDGTIVHDAKGAGWEEIWEKVYG